MKSRINNGTCFFKAIVYQSADVDRLSALDFADFIENNIDQFLKISHAKGINVALDLERDINVASDVLSPLTLILNEIISNAILMLIKKIKK